MKNLLRLIVLIFLPAVCSAQSTAPEALAILDRVVKEKQQITQTKLDLIAKTKEQFNMTKSKERQYKLIDEIYEEYRVFNLDSAEVFASKQLTLAKALNNTEYINHSILTLAEVYATEGLYLEALNLANSVNRHSLNTSNLKYCYHVYRMMYGFMADYSSKKSFHNEYVRQVNIYRDSLMLYQGKNTSSYAISESEKLLDKGHYKEAINLMLPWVKKSDMDMIRYLGYTLAMAYRQAGNGEREEYYLATSAIADLQSATKEYLSLLELSKLLYKRGDLDRAYNYMKCAMEDASYCNARLRTVEISQIYPIVEKTYQLKLQKKEQQRTIAFACITILAIVLAIVLFYLNKQKNKLSLFRQNLIDLNEALKHSNKKLTTANVSLVEANNIKEASLSRYMELCSFYIEKMNEYQHSLIKIASNEKVEALYRALRSSEFIEDELKDFYLNFDKTFLELFPTFVEEFNKMLVPDGRIYPKEKGQLNVELRIFALIRLGISDSAKIAKFLRYSVTTIYNYRVKIRNAAKGDRNTLEKEIMKIAQLNDLG